MKDWTVTGHMLVPIETAVSAASAPEALEVALARNLTGHADVYGAWERSTPTVRLRVEHAVERKARKSRKKVSK